MDSDKLQGQLSSTQLFPRRFSLVTLIIALSPFKSFFYVCTLTLIYALLVLNQVQVNLSSAKMEAKAAELLAAFKNPNVSVDTRVAHLTSLKSDIKQKNVPEGAIPSIFETLRLALNSQHYSVLTAGFSTLGHFLKRLFIQDQQQLVVSQARNFYPTLVERLGDHKERVRAQSAQIFTELWPAASADVEFHVLDGALVGRNPRAREMSMLWLSNMTKNHGLLFRTYVPSLVACLEDADSSVRDTARAVVIELFRTAPPRAKSDLQKQLVARGVRKSIANAIITGIGLSSTDSESSSTRPVSRVDRPISVMSSRSKLVELDDDDEPKSRPGSSKSHVDRPTTSHGYAEAGTIHRPRTPAEPSAAQDSSDDSVEPLTVSSAREIDDLVRDMLPCFDGKESEDNWMKREKNVILFRRLTCGNAPHALSQTYMAALKALLEGILKVVNSLRTTMCTAGCLLIQDVARCCGPKLDPMVEIIMQNLMKVCAALKKISAQNGNVTVDAVISNVTFTNRLLQHVHWASVDKNLQLRLFAAGWLRTLISRQSRQKSTVEHGGGLELVEKSIKKGLGDANPSVREAMRSTFWIFHDVWPDKADAIMSTLDPKSRNLLEKDPSNPNANQKASVSSGRTTAGGTASTPGRSALKEAIAARKRAQMPSRPESAHTNFSTSKPSEPASKSSATRTVPTGAPLSSLSSAPVRPGMKPRRAELSRPATADPYASRRPPSRGAGSPRTVRPKATTPTSKTLNAPRLRPHNDDPGTNTTRGKPRKLDLSKSKSHDHLLAASRARSDSNDSVHGHHLELPAGSEDQPAPIVLESPPLSASHPHLNHPKQPRSGHEVANANEDELQPMPLDEPSVPVDVTPARERDFESTLHQSALASDPETAGRPEPDSLVIYEDPMSPVAAEADASSHAFTPKEKSTPALTPFRLAQQKLRDAGAPAAAKDISVDSVETPVKKATPALVPDEEPASDHMNVETHLKSPTHQSQISQDSPSPVTVELPSAAAQSPPTRANTGNNENVMPHTGKAAEVVAAPRSAAKPKALEEVPVNESGARFSEARRRSFESLAKSSREDPAGRCRKWNDNRSISPRSKDPANAIDMIRKAQARIKSDTMDISGYRKLQTLFYYHKETIIPDKLEYNSMVNALLKELQKAPTDRKDQDVKTQILVTIRAMLTCTIANFHPCIERTLTAVIRARRHYESSSHIVTYMEELVDILVDHSLTEEAVIDGVIEGMNMGEEALKSEGAYRSIILGLSTLHQTILPAKYEHIPDESLSKVGAVVSEQLRHPRPGVRKQATELNALINSKFGDRLRNLAPPLQEGSLNLLTYFMARQNISR
ncbi:hypothetical protein N7474_000419 [Penicillium riverlandense]|uniref:uncharacterized protein n=1 Tax=Penicillium riverlandense TaxID=1903569 RepID=UPI0025479EAC|nr:uncharacterized protein N7474_000419 [Penicillium riverlandense]KAJ5832108.1 hypothetical protein N7474_000419 [Penicillium riverlandense]